MSDEESPFKIANSPFVLLPADIIEQINMRLKKIEDFIQAYQTQPGGRQFPHEIAGRFLTEEAKHDAIVRIQREHNWPVPRIEKIGITAQGILRIVRWQRGMNIGASCEYQTDMSDVTVIVALEDYSNTLNGEYGTYNGHRVFFKPARANVAVLAKNIVIPSHYGTFNLLSVYSEAPITYSPDAVVEIGVIGVRIGCL